VNIAVNMCINCSFVCFTVGLVLRQSRGDDFSIFYVVLYLLTDYVHESLSVRFLYNCSSVRSQRSSAEHFLKDGLNLREIYKLQKLRLLSSQAKMVSSQLLSAH